MAKDEEVTLTGAVKPKLVAAKQAWARDGRLLTGDITSHDRLPPGQTLVQDWPVLDLGVQPTVPFAAATLVIDGLVASPQSLDWAALQAMPQQNWVNDIHCVTQWSRYDNTWGGIALPALLALARPAATAGFVAMESHDGYTTNLPLADLDRDDACLAFSWGGQPLERQHGGPMRLVVPHLYLWKSPKWVKRLTLVAEDRPGFWEVRGYHHRGDPWGEERYG